MSISINSSVSISISISTSISINISISMSSLLARLLHVVPHALGVHEAGAEGPYVR